MTRALLVGLGGFFGSVGRYWVAGLVQQAQGSQFPLGTLAVNVAGSFILGLLMALSLERALLGPNMRLCLAVGFCGGFTTMSTFSYETIALLRDGSAFLGLLNAATTMALCLLGVWLGALMIRIL